MVYFDELFICLNVSVEHIKGEEDLVITEKLVSIVIEHVHSKHKDLGQGCKSPLDMSKDLFIAILAFELTYPFGELSF